MDEIEKRWWDFPAAIFLVVALTTVSYRLSDTKWTDYLEITIALTFIGVILGLALGYSRFNRHLAGLFGLIFTAFFVIWQLCDVGTSSQYIWVERIWLLGDRLLTNLGIFLRNQPLSDSFLFLANMALLFWIIAITTGYNLTRYGKPWQGLIIAGIAMLIIDIYHPPLAAQGVATAIYTILILLLVARLYYLKRAHLWQINQVGVDSDTGFNLVRGALVAAVIMVFLAWNAPNIVQAFTPNTPERRRMIQSWLDFRQRFENITTPLRGSVNVPTEYYADQFSLGTGSFLTDQTVFTIKPTITQRIGVAYYWRVRSYDTYSNGRWQSTIANSRSFSPSNANLNYEDLEKRLVVEFHVRPTRNLSMMLVPGLPVAINRPVTLVYDGADNQVQDIITVTVNPMIRPGTTYAVTSAIPAPTIADMRAASQDYPDWVSEAYLQLPPDLPASIPALAAEITDGIDNPYDQIAAITIWLRQNIEYAPTIPDPPADRDPVEWVLFEHKQAFCNYYASAQVLMLRSLGIPARWVIGYAQGELDTEEEFYWVRDKDRHAWPEVYFPGLGWVEFEPTAFQADINRPSGGASGDRTPFTPDGSNLPMLIDEFEAMMELQGREGFGSIDEQQSTPALIAISLILGAVIGIIAFIYFALGWTRRKTSPDNTLPALLERSLRQRGWSVPQWVVQWSTFSLLTPIERSFYTVTWVNRILGVNPSLSWTPAEQIYALVHVMPKGNDSAGILLQEYQKAIYSPHPANVQAAQNASQTLWKQALQKRGKMILSKVFPKIYPSD
jgi:transglutaminase-like putative cysteine protease